MARMHPEDIEDYEKATEGEKRVFRFLKEEAKPDAEYTCWYQPSVGKSGKEPDFVLFSAELGFLVLEVKDWAAHQIAVSTPHRFTILVKGEKKVKTNPEKQARGYVRALMEELSPFPEFVSEQPEHRGSLKIPIGEMVVFPNISRKEYSESRFKWLLTAGKVLLKEDLGATGEILCDSSGRRFREKISEAFPFRFQGLTRKEAEKLCFVLWPEVKMEIPSRRGAGKSRFQKEVLALDEAQARVALRLGSGHQIIKGPPGCGKTLVLAYRCCHLRKYGPQEHRILFVCYNIALVAYLKRLIQEDGAGVGGNGITVCHFFELCARILGEPVHYENEESDYYEMVVEEALDRASGGQTPVGLFDAVLVDEGQDFSDKMFKVVLALLRPGGDLVVAMDSDQDLYRRRSSWKSVGISASGRSRYLKKVYRNTRELYDFTQRFIGQGPRVKTQLALLPSAFVFHGPPPELHRFSDPGAIDSFLVGDLRRCLDQEGYKRSEIGIIYDDKVYGPDRFAYDNRALPMRILGKLEKSGIPSVWVSQDVRSKEMYDITTDRVSLISIHSSKGLDFDLVYLAGIDHIRPTHATRLSILSTIYVAMTRAKYRLVIPYVEETELVKRMKDCLG